MRKPFATLLTLAGVLLPASAAHAQSPLPDVRPETVVNTVTAGSQTSPGVAASFGTVWITWADVGQAPAAVKARRFDPSGAPLGPEIVVRSGASLPYVIFLAGPRIGTTADGGCVVVWAETPDVWFRRFDGSGAPLGEARRIAPAANVTTNTSPGVAVASGGSFAVSWLRSDVLGDTIQLQRFDAQGQSLGAFETVASGPQNTLGIPRMAGAADGGFLAVWRSSAHLFARRYGGTGAASAVFPVDNSATGNATDAAAALADDGKATVIWLAGHQIWGRRVGATGEPMGDVSEVAAVEAGPALASLAVATDRDGNSVAAWSAYNQQLKARLLKPDLTPLSAVFPAADPAFPATDPALATTPSGGTALVWSSGFDVITPFLNPPPVAGRDGSARGVVARVFGPTRCAAGSGILCLGAGHRFESRVSWRNPSTGETGSGQSLPLTGDTGAFWFFGAQNLELMVKVLDGTAVNGHYWVYGGSLTDIEYTLTVADTFTNAERTYHHPAGQFASLADVNAFPSLILDPPPPGAPPDLTPGPGSIPGCPPLFEGPQSSLCLGSGHFTVSVDFMDPRSGLSGHGTAVPLTADTGAFWFFDDSNLELMIKVLDGRAVNGKFWVFYGALSDVDYTITVTRLDTGEVRTYHNPGGTLASRADTQAF